MAKSPTDQKRLGEIMRQLHYEGMRSDKVMKAAHQILREEKGIPEMTVQQRRYAMRKSFENPRKKKIRKSCPTCGGLQSGPVCLTCIKKNPGAKVGDTITEGRLKGGKIYALEKYGNIVVEKDGKFYRVSGLVGFKKNPIAIYNPPRGQKLPMEIIEIRYRRSGGKYKGQLFKHKFKTRPTVTGLSDGSIIIKGSERLWGPA